MNTFCETIHYLCHSILNRGGVGKGIYFPASLNVDIVDDENKIMYLLYNLVVIKYWLHVFHAKCCCLKLFSTDNCVSNNSNCSETIHRLITRFTVGHTHWSHRVPIWRINQWLLATLLTVVDWQIAITYDMISWYVKYLSRLCKTWQASTTSGQRNAPSMSTLQGTPFSLNCWRRTLTPHDYQLRICCSPLAKSGRPANADIVERHLPVLPVYATSLQYISAHLCSGTLVATFTRCTGIGKSVLHFISTIISVIDRAVCVMDICTEKSMINDGLHRYKITLFDYSRPSLGIVCISRYRLYPNIKRFNLKPLWL